MRSLLLIPADSDAATRAAASAADAAAIDIAAAPPDRRHEARAAAREALARIAAARKPAWVRIASTYSLLARDDVRALVCRELAGIVVPFCDRAEQLLYLEALLRDAEPATGVAAGTVRLIAGIGSAAGVLRAAEIAKGSPRLAALLLDGETLAADLSIERTTVGTELAYARSAVAIAARAAGILALDGPYPGEDEEGLLADARAARALGMAGKAIRAPEHAAPINRLFTPDRAALVWAQEAVAAYEQAAKEGLGAALLDGALIDTPAAERARALLARANGTSQRRAGSRRGRSATA
jgi:citrate lyase subunit beta/citryl-CoA lyase